ncbi:MAG TPA: PsiF family protein [Steroidobacteraceae bacterium]|nr:PsiF family protein [Steroidobacteraceae bacterium]
MNSRILLAALAILAAGAALAADPPSAPTATPVKHPTLKACNREATAKQLSGKQREQFVRDCTAGKTPAAPPPAPRADHG